MKNNNLLLTLDDATKVAMRFLRDYLVLGKDEIEGVEEIARSELEQKCYIGDSSEDLMYALSEITPQSIAKEIANDRLGEWCINMQVLLQMQVADAIAKGK